SPVFPGTRPTAPLRVPQSALAFAGTLAIVRGLPERAVDSRPRSLAAMERPGNDRGRGMKRFLRVIVLNLWAATAVLVGGCMGSGRPAALPTSRDTPLVLDLPNLDQDTIARSQRPDL